MADTASNQLRVRLVTPERTLFESEATAVELPSKSGYMEALYGHAPLMAELGAGDVRVHTGPGLESTSPDTTRYNVSWGFVEVLPERVTILAETALHPEEIDKAEAQAELQAGEKMWHEAGDDGEKYDAANAQMRQAEEKIASSEGRV